MKKIYPSKKAKRKAEYIERKKKREIELKRRRAMSEPMSMEEMAAALGIRLR